MFACFGCAAEDPDVFNLPRSELKKLYDKCIAVNKGKLIVQGIFARADTKNNNKRVYPKYILKREVAKFELEHIQRGSALGELDHPNYASRFFKCMNLPNISHQVLRVQWKGDQLWGTIEILPTPSGLLLWELYAQGIKLGVSSRGWASLRTDTRANCVYVDDDFELITFDFVTEPSTKGAYLVPLAKPYRHPVPDQFKCVQTAFLGHGVVSMRNIPRLPSVAHLARRIKELQDEANDCYKLATGSLQPLDFTIPCLPETPLMQPTPSLVAARAGRGRSLDQLLLFCHYIVFPGAAYLDREEHARDFQAHVALFATRAHLADQDQFAKHRADFNTVMLQEVVKQQAKKVIQADQQGSKPQQASAAVAVAAGAPTPTLVAPPQAVYCAQNKQAPLPVQPTVALASAKAAAAATAAGQAVERLVAEADGCLAASMSKGTSIGGGGGSLRGQQYSSKPNSRSLRQQQQQRWQQQQEQQLELALQQQLQAQVLCAANPQWLATPHAQPLPASALHHSSSLALLDGTSVGDEALMLEPALTSLSPGDAGGLLGPSHAGGYAHHQQPSPMQCASQTLPPSVQAQPALPPAPPQQPGLPSAVHGSHRQPPHAQDPGLRTSVHHQVMAPSAAKPAAAPTGSTNNHSSAWHTSHAQGDAPQPSLGTHTFNGSSACLGRLSCENNGTCSKGNKSCHDPDSNGDNCGHGTCSRLGSTKGSSASLRRPASLGSMHEKGSLSIGQAEGAEAGSRLLQADVCIEKAAQLVGRHCKSSLQACSDLDSWVLHPSSVTTAAVLEASAELLCVMGSSTKNSASDLQELQDLMSCDAARAQLPRRGSLGNRGEQQGCSSLADSHHRQQQQQQQQQASQAQSCALWLGSHKSEKTGSEQPQHQHHQHQHQHHQQRRQLGGSLEQPAKSRADVCSDRVVVLHRQPDCSEPGSEASSGGARVVRLGGHFTRLSLDTEEDVEGERMTTWLPMTPSCASQCSSRTPSSGRAGGSRSGTAPQAVHAVAGSRGCLQTAPPPPLQPQQPPSLPPRQQLQQAGSVQHVGSKQAAAGAIQVAPHGRQGPSRAARQGCGQQAWNVQDTGERQQPRGRQQQHHHQQQKPDIRQQLQYLQADSALSPLEFWSKYCKDSAFSRGTADSLTHELGQIKGTMAAYSAKQHLVWSRLMAGVQGTSIVACLVWDDAM